MQPKVGSGAPLVAAALGLSLVGTFMVGVQPSASSTELAVIAAPWSGTGGAIALVAQAGGATVAVGGLPNVIIAQSDAPDFAGSLYRAGAWLVLDAGWLRGCLGLTFPSKGSLT